MSVSKVEQIDETKRRSEEDAARLREIVHDIELAIKHGVFEIADSLSRAFAVYDCEALRRVANWRESLIPPARSVDDPLIVVRHRGDPIVRGVQILVGLTLEEQFGERLDGTAAT